MMTHANRSILMKTLCMILMIGCLGLSYSTSMAQEPDDHNEAVHMETEANIEAEIHAELEEIIQDILKEIEVVKEEVKDEEITEIKVERDEEVNQEVEISEQYTEYPTYDAPDESEIESKQPTHRRQKRGILQFDTFYTVEEKDDQIIKTTWRKVKIPAKYGERLVPRKRKECTPVEKYIDYWLDYWCTTYEDVWVDYWQDSDGNWGGGKYERREKKEYCGDYVRKYYQTNQCVEIDTSYIEVYKISDETTANEFVSTQYYTYEQFNAEHPLDRRFPKKKKEQAST